MRSGPISHFVGTRRSSRTRYSAVYNRYARPSYLVLSKARAPFSFSERIRIAESSTVDRRTGFSRGQCDVYFLPRSRDRSRAAVYYYYYYYYIGRRTRAHARATNYYCGCTQEPIPRTPSSVYYYLFFVNLLLRKMICKWPVNQPIITRFGRGINVVVITV